MNIARPALLLAALCTAQCGGDDASDVKRTYLGMKDAVVLAIDLGLTGYNAASGGTVLKQIGNGKISGMLAVSGSVDQGASGGQVVQLAVELSEYEDRQDLTYSTEGGALELAMSIKAPPIGTMTGSLSGTASLDGALKAQVSPQLELSAQLEPKPDDSKKVRRKADTLEVSGTVSSSYGTYEVVP